MWYDLMWFCTVRLCVVLCYGAMLCGSVCGVVWCEKRGRRRKGRELSEVLVVRTLVLVSRYAFVGRV